MPKHYQNPNTSQQATSTGGGRGSNQQQALTKGQPKPTGYHTPGTPAYLNRFRAGGDLYGRTPTGYHTPGTPAWLHRFRPGGDKENDPKPTGWWTKGHQNYHKNYT